ncbi:MAG TPA: ABC transporter permease [Thermoanaerobaculia bacterium]|jgi:predicted permease|nr:ABC transporter permease [Thermoanaerobaculia bacterium]
MRELMRHLMMTVRSLARQPAVTVPAVLTLALGIGANTALFAYLSALAWPRLETRDAQRVVFVYSGTAKEARQQTQFPDYAAMAREQTAVSELTAYSSFGSSVGLPEQTTFAWGQAVSGGYFSFYDARPAVGRLLGPQDDRPEAPLVMVLSHAFWKGALGGDPRAVGRTLRMNGLTVTMVGVGTEGFSGPGLPAALYVPLAQVDRITGMKGRTDSKTRWLSLTGRLAPGTFREQAQAALDQLARSLDETAPLGEGKRRFSVVLAEKYDVEYSASAGDPYLDAAKILTAAAGLFLLLGCASIANLLLARATARQREWAIRASLGAGRWRLAGSVFLESTLLCLAGGAAGLPFAAVLARRIDTYVATPPPGLGNWGEGTTLVHVDTRAVAFALGVSLLCAFLGSLGPLLRVARRDLLDPLKSDAAGSGTAAGALNARRVLVVAQVALSVVLLLAGGLLVRSLDGAQKIDPGFSPDRMLLATVYIPRALGGGSASALYNRVLEEVRDVPGLTSASVSQVPPLGGWSQGTQVAPHENPEARIPANYNLVAPDYFATVGIPILQGRPLDRRDRRDAAPAVVVSQVLARKLWGDGSAVGRLLDVTQPPHPGEPGPVFEVVGVTADVRSISPVEPPGSMIYLSQEQRSVSRMTVLARTAGPPLAEAAALRGALRKAHPDIAVVEMAACRDQLDKVLILPRLYAEVAGLFGLLGLAVAVVGLFGLLSYSVSLRGREMSIRMAVGARPWDVWRLVVRQGMTLVALGIVLGIAAAFCARSLLASLLFGVGAADPLTFVAVPVVLAIVAFAACDLPARRAAGLDPSAVLRNL